MPNQFAIVEEVRPKPVFKISLALILWPIAGLILLLLVWWAWGKRTP